MSKTIFLTGEAGFISSALVRFLINKTEHTAITYEGNIESLRLEEYSACYHFVQGDICEREEYQQYSANISKTLLCI